MRRLTTFIIILILFIPLLALNFTVKTQEENWVTVERGVDFVRRQNVADPSLFSWESAPMLVLNEATDEYVPYIYWRDEAKKCHVVRSALIAAEIYDTGIAKFFDPELTEERVKSETWKLFVDDGGVWKEASLSSTIAFNVTQTPTSIIIEAERATSKPTGQLLIRYLFREGTSLKHEIFWISNSAETETVQVRQVWDLKLSTDRVVLDDGNIVTSLVTSSTTTNSTTYLFGDESNSFLVLESQWSAVYFPDGTLRDERFVEADINFSGKKVTFTFGNWTLLPSEGLEIDPSTLTFDDPTEDGHIEYYVNDETYTRYADSTQIAIGSGLAGEYLWTYRGYAEWNVSSIPDSAIITDTVFKYHGVYNPFGISCRVTDMKEARPSTSGDEAIYNEVGLEPYYVDPEWFPQAGSNKQVDLGSTADSDLESQLASDWFAIGLQSDNEGSFTHSSIYSEESSADPKPTLYVVYYVPVYITLETDPSGLQVRIDGSEWFDSPNTFEVDSGISHSIEANDPQSAGEGERYVWVNWNDSGANPHNVSPTENITYTADFDTECFFDVNSNYGSPTGEGWYLNGTSTVNSTVITPSGDYNTTGWTGTGSLESGGTANSNTTGAFTITEYSTCTWDWVGPSEGGGEEEGEEEEEEEDEDYNTHNRDSEIEDILDSSDPLEALGKTVYAVTSNVFSGFLLVFLLFGVGIAYYLESRLWVLLLIVFIVLAFNFLFVFVLFPLDWVPELFFLDPVLLRLPRLELSTYAFSFQAFLQVSVMAALLCVLGAPIVLISWKRMYQ